MIGWYKINQVAVQFLDKGSVLDANIMQIKPVSLIRLQISTSQLYLELVMYFHKIL